MRQTRTILLLILMLLLTGCSMDPADAELSAEPAPTEPSAVIGVYELDALPEAWDWTAEQTAEVEFLRKLTGSRLYELSADGSTVLPELAAALPVDVTAEYAGTYNVPEDAARGYAFRIDLNEAACWNDGAPITADDYRSSMENEAQLSDFAFLVNGAGFLNGREKPAKRIISLMDAGYDSVAEAEADGVTDFYLDMEHFWGLEAGWVSINDRTRLRDLAMPGGLDELFVSAAYLYESYLADGASYSYLQQEFVGIPDGVQPRLTFQDVGIEVAGEYRLVLILDEPMTAEALALKLRDFRLLTGEGRSCGPYQTVSADGTLIELERNPNWWGDEAQLEADILRCRLAG